MAASERFRVHGITYQPAEKTPRASSRGTAHVIVSDEPPLGSTKPQYCTPATRGSSYRPATTAASTTSRRM